jgi:hypothetical protein
VIDAVLVTAAVIGFGANLVLAQRLDELRRKGRAPNAPRLARYLLWSGQWWATSSAHRQVNDRPTTVLVWVIRIALAVFLMAGMTNLIRR